MNFKKTSVSLRITGPMALLGALAMSSLVCAGDVPAKNRIIGGSEVESGDPIAGTTVALVAALAQGESSGGEEEIALCTGSLIAPDLVVTAAHCVDGASEMVVVFGTDIHAKASQRATVVGTIVPSTWNGASENGKDQSDIALVRFQGTLPSGYAVARILTDDAVLKNGETVTLAGYGESKPAAKSQKAQGAGILRKTDVQIKDANYGKTEMIFDQSRGTGACHGDSGGPAFVDDGDGLLLVGLTNRAYGGDDCNADVVYTKIGVYLPWLKKAAAQLRSRS